MHALRPRENLHRNLHRHVYVRNCAQERTSAPIHTLGMRTGSHLNSPALDMQRWWQGISTCTDHMLYQASAGLRAEHWTRKE